MGAGDQVSCLQGKHLASLKFHLLNYTLLAWCTLFTQNQTKEVLSQIPQNYLEVTEKISRTAQRQHFLPRTQPHRNSIPRSTFLCRDIPKPGPPGVREGVTSVLHPSGLVNFSLPLSFPLGTAASIRLSALPRRDQTQRSGYRAGGRAQGLRVHALLPAGSSLVSPHTAGTEHESSGSRILE